MKISVALAMYNGEKNIIQQLNSILNQSYPVDEIVISDDGSTDNSFNVVKDYITNHKVKVKLVKNIHSKGYKGNFITAFESTTGDIIFLSDQDDYWLSNKIDDHINAHVNYDCDLCSSNFNVINIDGQIVDMAFKGNCKYKKCSAMDIMTKYMFNGMSISIKRHDDFNEMLRLMCNENVWAHDTFINIYFAIKYNVLYINEICTNHIVHDKNVAGARVGYRMRGSYIDRLKIADNYYKLYSYFDELISKKIISPKSNDIYSDFVKCKDKAIERYDIYKSKNATKLLFHALKYRNMYSSYKTFLAEIYTAFKRFRI